MFVSGLMLLLGLTVAEAVPYTTSLTEVPCADRYVSMRSFSNFWSPIDCRSGEKACDAPADYYELFHELEHGKHVCLWDVRPVDMAKHAEGA